MAIRYEISLSTTEPNNSVGVLKIRQSDEETQTIVVNKVTEQGIPKNFEGYDVFFCAKLGENDGLGIIEQRVEVLDPKAGTLEYTLKPQDWQVLGKHKAYFAFRKLNEDHTFTEQFTTRDFEYQVIKSVFSDGVQEVQTDGSTYVWTFEDLLRMFNEYIESGKSDWEEFVEQNKEILESVDPGGKVLKELIDSRTDADNNTFPSVPERLNTQFGNMNTFREWEQSIIEKVSNELSERSINVRWFGAKGGNHATSKEDTQAFKKACEVARANGGAVIHVPDGRYCLNETIYLPERTTLTGQGQYTTKIVHTDALINEPVIATDGWNYTNDVVKNIEIRNLCILSYGEREVYPIQLRNTSYVLLDNVYVGATNKFGGSEAVTHSNQAKHGIHFERKNGYDGSMHLLRINNCRLSSVSAVIKGSDNIITNNELWGTRQEFVLELAGAHNSIISNNEIVPGEVYGGIYFTGNNEGLKINGIYFDGSYNEVDTAHGMYSAENTQLKNCVVVGNNFWKMKSSAMYLDEVQGSLFNSNTFHECDYMERGFSDLTIRNPLSFGNAIQGNTHFRALTIVNGALETRHSDKYMPPFVLNQQDLKEATTVIGNTVQRSQQYVQAEYKGGKFFVFGNNMPLFENLIENDKMTHYPLNKEIRTKERNSTSTRILEIYNRWEDKFVPIANPDVLKTSQYPTNIDVISTNVNIYIDDVSKVTGLPSSLIGTGSFIVVNSSYDFNERNIVIYAKLVNGTGHAIFTRSMLNGVWGEWSDDRNLNVAGRPSVVPTRVGQFYFDTLNKKMYVAFGTNSASDWEIMN